MRTRLPFTYFTTSFFTFNTILTQLYYNTATQAKFLANTTDIKLASTKQNMFASQPHAPKSPGNQKKIKASPSPRMAIAGYGWLKNRHTLFFSIHPLLVEWDNNSNTLVRRFVISIHPLLVEWDFCVISPSRASPNFNPPTPCGVGRQKVCFCAIFLREAFIFKYRLLASIRQVSFITSAFTSFHLLSHKNYGANCPAFGRQL